MPNWVTTIINFEGEQENIDTIFDLIKGSEDDEDSTFDFNRLIPMPDNIYTGNLGMKERELYGANNWYDWSIANWGTKWNACSPNRYGNTLEFNTAWGLCEPVLEKLAELCYEHKVTFSGYFCDEDWGSSNKGYLEAYDGEFYADYVDRYNLKSDIVRTIIVNCYGEDCYEDMLDYQRECEEEDEDD